MFRKYLEEYPDSPWAAEAALHIGCDATYNGRYSEAESIFTKLIAQNQGKDHSGAKMMLNKARQRLALLKVEQNNLDGGAGRCSACCCKTARTGGTAPTLRIGFSGCRATPPPNRRC